MFKKMIIVSALALMSALVSLPMRGVAQDDVGSEIEMADKMRSEGKIYVVVLVVTIVFTGLLVYAANTDRKLSRLEKEIESMKTAENS